MRFAILVVMVGVGACVEANVTTCADGRVCPSSTVCDDIHTKCVLPEQLTTCAGMADSIACEITGRDPGVCKDQVCLVAGCGDGYITGSEQCDLSVPAERDDCVENGFYGGGAVGCTTDCTLDRRACVGRCGDGVINGNEVCDDSGTGSPTDDQLNGKTCLGFGFYSAPGIACSAACTFNVDGCAGFCGDGIVNGTELCDGAQLAGVNSCDDLGFYDTEAVSCTDGCSFDTSSCNDFCGDGVTNGGEACDPGLTSSTSDDDLAGSTCTDFAYYRSAGLACSAACTYVTTGCDEICGDGVRNGPEDCDDNDTATSADDDLASADCTRLGFYFAAGLGCSAACGFDDSQCDGFCGDRTADPGFELCEGGPPAGQTCLQYGFESGPLDCLGSCGLDFRGCHRSTWSGTTVGSNTYHDAWSSRPGDVFTVGSAGSILHFNGGTWTAMASNTSNELMSVWGFAANDVFAVGLGGTILHYDGALWSAMNSGTSEPLLGVWGTAGDDVYAVGLNGTLLHYTGGTAWSQVPGIASVGLSAVWGSGPNDVYAIGDDRTLLHYTGGPTWSSTTLTNSIGGIRAISGSGPDDIYIVGQTGGVVHWDGLTWSLININTQSSLYDVWASGPRDVYIGAVNSTVVHFDGGSWTTLDTGGLSAIDGVWGTSPSEVFAVGSNGMLRRLDAEAWRAQAAFAQSTLNDAWGNSPTNVYAVGLGNLFHFDGSNWKVQLVNGGGAPNLLTVWGSSSSDIFAVGVGGAMIHYDGSAWATIVPPFTTNMHALWGTGPTNVIAVGANGENHVFNGAWAPGPSTGVSVILRGIWGASATNVFAIGDNGTIIHRTAGTWSAMISTTSKALYAVWGSSATDVYAVGDMGTLLHYNGVGNQWTAITGVTTADLRGVTGSGPADVFVAGTNGVVYHFDGLTWSVMQSATALTLRDITLAGGDVFAVGEGVITQRSRACLPTETLCGDAVDNDCDGRYDCGDADCPCSAGGVCAGATTIQCGDTLVIPPTAPTTDLLDRYVCDPVIETGPERMFKLAALSTTSATATLSGMTADLDLVVLAAGAGGGCEPRSPGCLAAQSTTSATEAVTFSVLANNSYYLIVDAYGAGTSGFTLQLSCP